VVIEELHLEESNKRVATSTSKTKMFQEVRDNLDENLGRLHDLKDRFKDHPFLEGNSDLKKTFENASEMLDSLNDENVLRPYKDFLNKFNEVEAMLNEVKSRCLFGR